MKLLFIIFLFLRFTWTFAQMNSIQNFSLPFHYEHRFPPLNSNTFIDIKLVENHLFEVNYTVKKNGISTSAKDEFTEKIVSMLFEKISQNEKRDIKNWKSDQDCILKEWFRLKFGTHKKEFCSNDNMRKNLQSFQNSVEVILRK